jgi:hypothetical protein
VGIRNTLKRLERESEEFYETLRLPDGREIRYEASEMLDAFAAYMDGREHWLLPYIWQMDTRQGIPGLIRALEESSRELHGG